MEKKQTLEQAIYLSRTRKSRDLDCASLVLSGMPEGGWSETGQAIGNLRDLLPPHGQRAYSIADWIHAVYLMEYGRFTRRW